jgi:DNA-binding transcriptional LysR family regulator
MDLNDFSTLAAFLAVAEERSFTRAAKRHGVSPSAMSRAIRGLEEDIGVRLFSRTTRSVSPTEAGERLLTRLRPALTDVQEALDQLSGLRNEAAGRLRLLVPRLAGTELLAPKLAQFTLDHWCQPFPGFFLYYPSRRQQPAALSALIDTLRL